MLSQLSVLTSQDFAELFERVLVRLLELLQFSLVTGSGCLKCAVGLFDLARPAKFALFLTTEGFSGHWDDVLGLGRCDGEFLYLHLESLHF